MRIGMLWYDNDPKETTEAKVDKAASYYTKKYNAPPNLCFVHPTMIPAIPEGTTMNASDVEIRPNKYVLPNYFWLGVHQEE